MIVLLYSKNLNTMKILIIDDEKEICQVLKANLETESFVVDWVLSGEEGLSLIKKNNYDLIILDYNLPIKNGQEVCREIRGKKITTPIIMLSVNTETAIKVETLNVGADDYLTKPFSFEELLARMRALLRRPEKIADEQLKISDLILDTRKYTVTKGAESIKLTKKEFSLLEYLLRNKGIVLSRGMILENVWDMNADPFSNTIESHIVSLRKKIKDTGKDRIIQTVSGRGYKIND